MYIETSTGRLGDVARLLSPIFSSTGLACLVFSYHMYGTHTGNLSAIISTEQRSIPVWSARSNHGNRWFTEYLQLQFTEDFQVVMEASRGNGYRGDIAIDDVMLFPGKCPAATMCTFESGFCDLVNDKVMDDFDWILGQYTRTPTTGPRFDHTFGNGFFAYIEASFPRKPGHTANLLTPFFYANHTRYCVSLWYFMYGVDVSTLKLTLRRNNGMEKKLWSINGDQGRAWQQVNVTIPANSFKFQIVIQAKVGSSYNSDIAMDDFSVREGACQ